MSEFFSAARWWELKKDHKIQCNLCPRHCILKDGQRGFCFVRQNQSGKMILTTYGKSTGFCIDPIEKKPLNQFYPGSNVLSFGTAGCNLGCLFCQNWTASKSKENDLYSQKAMPEEIVKACLTHNAKSIAFTYNDPIVFAEYAIDTADICREEGINTVAVTAGYIEREARLDFFSRMDAANVDLKAFSEEFYQKYVSAHLSPVLDTLKFIKKETDTWLEITNLIIPGLNDNAEEIKQMSNWILNDLGENVPVHFSAFHPAYKMDNMESTPLSSLKSAYDIAKKEGINYVYTGNVYNLEGDITFCPGCNYELIVRNWYEIEKYDLKGSNCPKCGYKIAGNFDNTNENWGRKRVPVDM